MKIENYIAFLLVILFAVSCTKNLSEIDAEWSVVKFPTDSPVKKVFYDSLTGNGYAVGGEQFGIGWVAYTSDDWETFTWDSLGERVILDIHCFGPQNCIAVGFEGQIYGGHPDFGWRLNVGPKLKRLNGIDRISDDRWLVVGGSGLGDGIVHFVDANGDIHFTQDSFIHEFADVVVTGDDRFQIAGYGILLKGQGRSDWEVADVQGDFYKALSRSPEGNLWAVGEFGSILKSTDEGESWTKLRNGNLIWTSDLAFQDIAMWDVETGMLTGSNGICWLTKDEGDTWEEVTGLDDLDLSGIALLPDDNIGRRRCWIGASDGQLLQMTFPK